MNAHTTRVRRLLALKADLIGRGATSDGTGPDDEHLRLVDRQLILTAARRNRSVAAGPSGAARVPPGVRFAVEGG